MVVSNYFLSSLEPQLGALKLNLSACIKCLSLLNSSAYVLNASVIAGEALHVTPHGKLLPGVLNTETFSWSLIGDTAKNTI